MTPVSLTRMGRRSISFERVPNGTTGCAELARLVTDEPDRLGRLLAMLEAARAGQAGSDKGD